MQCKQLKKNVSIKKNHKELKTLRKTTKSHE